DVAVEARGVREDERDALDLEHGLIAAGRLALAAVEVEVALRPDVVEHLREVGMDLLEDAAAAVHQLLHGLERAQRRAALGVDREIPRPQRIDAELPAPTLVAAAQRGDDGRLVRAVEVEAVLRGVVEPPARLEG